MHINPSVVKAAATYVNSYFKTHLNGSFLYHNPLHTRYVVKAAAKLCEVTGVGAKKKSILLTAAWFHDLGFTVQIEGHERAGAALAEDFLKAKGIDENDITLVKACILATCYPQEPTNLLEDILCDADLLYLGDACFFSMSEALRQEWYLTRGMTYTDEEWCKQNIRFLSAHRFQTPYGASVTEGGKQQNISWLKAKPRLIEKSNSAELLQKALFLQKPISAMKRTPRASVPNTLNVRAARA